MFNLKAQDSNMGTENIGKLMFRLAVPSIIAQLISVVLLTIMSLILTVVMLIFKEPLLYLFGASSVTYEYANSYITIYLLGTIFVQYSLGLNLFISSQGKSKIAMFTVLIGAITNIILDPIFIFVFDLGVAGAAIATVISQALSAFFVIYYLTSDKSIFQIKKKYLKIDCRIHYHWESHHLLCKSQNQLF